MPCRSEARSGAGVAITDDETLAPVIFSTDEVERRHQFDLWRATYEPFNRMKELDGAATSGGFAARNEVWPLGGMALLRNSGPPLSFERTLGHIRRDSVDHWVIRILLKGRSRFRSGGASFEMRPFAPLVFSLGVPFEGDRTAADWVSLYIPRDAFPDLSAGFVLLSPRVVDNASARLLADYVLALEQRLPLMARSQVPALVQATRSMVAACLLTGLDPGAVTPQDTAAAQFEHVRAIIRQNIASPSLDPRRICRLAAMSRSQLYRLFEPHGGVARYVQGMRLRMVHAMLGDPSASHLPIAAIAEHMGFHDASAFSRVFRREFGYTPREARAAALDGLPAPEPTAAAGAGASAEERTTEDFVALLRRLGATTRTAAPLSRPVGGAGCVARAAAVA
jgi:AraC-like DNA-binding protein